MLKVDVDITPLEGACDVIILRTQHLEPQLEPIGEDLVAAIQDKFDSGPFQPLAKSTVRYKLRKGKTAQPIIFNGTWKREHTPHVGSNFVKVTTTVPYAVYHVSKEARTIIPLRNPYELPDVVYQEAAQRLAHYIATGEIT